MNRQDRPIWNFCNRLYKISLHPGEPYQTEKAGLLNAVPDMGKFNAGEYILLHDTLLAMLAWPGNRLLLDLSQKAMDRLLSSIRQRVPHERRLEYQLNGTGIAGTEITGQFSYEITKWLVHEFGHSVTLHSWDASPGSIKLFFRQLLPRVEYESIFAGEHSPVRRIKKLKGNSSQTELHWLMKLMEQSTLPDAVKDFLFNELKIFITWKLDHVLYNRSNLSVPVHKIFYHTKKEGTTDIKKIVTRPLPAPSRLSTGEKIQRVNMAKATLVFLYRETDPFTFASAGDLTCYDLEKGYSVVLCSLQKEHRLSIESYIGYLVCKNGVPVAYGGGWIFGERCQFGINILAPFRGGESGYILSQLIRVYYHTCGARLFVVKPYQFGLKNKEGLASGAFWFYYKYGFRPQKVSLQELARSEWEKKKADKTYRTSLHTLKQFTTANLQLLTGKEPVPLFDASEVSKSITNFINRKYDGNREKAIRGCFLDSMKALNLANRFAWNLSEKKVFEEWSLLSGATLDMASWNTREKKQWIRLLRSKANYSEFDFIRRLQNHKRFWKDLEGKFG